MKNLFYSFLVVLSVSAFAKDYKIVSGKADYTVKHLVKTVKGESKEVKGKMSCSDKGECEFLIAIPVKSFISSDSNRDLNMLTILEATKFPLVLAKGKVNESDFLKDQSELKATVSFHGIEKEYSIKLTGGKNQKGVITVLLEDHKVERPSLLTVKIDNEVPVAFDIQWGE